MDWVKNLHWKCPRVVRSPTWKAYLGWLPARCRQSWCLGSRSPPSPVPVNIVCPGLSRRAKYGEVGSFTAIFSNSLFTLSHLNQMQMESFLIYDNSLETILRTQSSYLLTTRLDPSNDFILRCKISLIIGKTSTHSWPTKPQNKSSLKYQHRTVART